jgi:phage terminase large subunit GpA-like protein
VQTRYKEGWPYRVWVLPPGTANEARDTAVYALAARHATRVRLDLLPRPANPPPDPRPDPPEGAPPVVADVPSDMPPPQYQSRRSRVLVRSRYLVGE